MADLGDISRRMISRFYLFLLILGLFFYVGWGLIYGSWDITKADNMGVYAVTILLVGFGATGFLLYRSPEKAPEGTEKP